MKMRKIISLFAAMTVIASFATTMTVANAKAYTASITATVTNIEETESYDTMYPPVAGYDRYLVTYSLNLDDFDAADYGLLSAQVEFTSDDMANIGATTFNKKGADNYASSDAGLKNSKETPFKFAGLNSSELYDLEASNVILTKVWLVETGKQVEIVPTDAKVTVQNWEDDSQVRYAQNEGTLAFDSFTVGKSAPAPKEFTWNYGAETDKAGYKVEGQGFVWKQINVENASLAVNAQGVLTSGGESYSKALNFGEIDNGSFTVGVVSDKDAMDFEIVTDED